MTITLQLVDQATGALLATSEAELDSLPRSFEGMDTTLTVGDTPYHVAHAQPPTREAIAAAGKVTLLLRKLEMVNPADILFSLPTLEDALPPAEPDAEPAPLQIAADDWRQFELVARARLDVVDAELAAVKAVLETQRVGGGFKKLHVRRGLAAPLAGAKLTVAEVEAALGASARPFGVRGEVARAAGGFAVPTAEALVYGVADGGFVHTLAVLGMKDDVVGSLHGLARAHDLVLVDWCNAARYVAHADGFAV